MKKKHLYWLFSCSLPVCCLPVIFSAESVMTRDVKIKVGWYSSEHSWKRKNLWISAKSGWRSMRAQAGYHNHQYSCFSYPMEINSVDFNAPSRELNQFMPGFSQVTMQRSQASTHSFTFFSAWMLYKLSSFHTKKTSRQSQPVPFSNYPLKTMSSQVTSFLHIRKAN